MSPSFVQSSHDCTRNRISRCYGALKLRTRYAFNLSPSQPVSWHPIVGWRRRLQSCSCLSKWYCCHGNGHCKQVSFKRSRTGSDERKIWRELQRCASDFAMSSTSSTNGGVHSICTNLNNSLNVDVESLLICHNETSTGITQDAAAIAEMCQRHKTSFILDGITSVGGLPVHPQEWNAEAVVMGAQKWRDPQELQQ